MTPRQRRGSVGKGPAAAALAILVFFGGSVLAVHLIYLEPAAALVGATVEPEAPVALPEEAPAPPSRGAPARPAPRVAPPVASATAPAGAGSVEACVARAAQVIGDADPPTLPGRWPALKRAREERRLRLVQARTACERERAR